MSTFGYPSRNAKIFTKKIADVLSEVDKDDAKTYQANYEAMLRS